MQKILFLAWDMALDTRKKFKYKYMYILFMYYELDMLKIYVKIKNNEKGLEDDKKM
jgi:hypothetical protein